MAVSDPQSLAADPGVNAFVMANAGSGKTTTLVSRVARLLLGGSRPDAVLCLTFTKAAAAEMQRRLYERLGKWAIAPDAGLRVELGRLEQRDPASYDRGQLSHARTLFARALETPGGLKIQTIHAFCEQLLRRFPIEAGVSPLFRVVDDIEAEAIRVRARERVAERSLSGDAGLSDAYASLAGQMDFQAFEQMFVRFEEKRASIAAWVSHAGGPATLLQRIADQVGVERLEDPDALEAEAISPPALNLDHWFAAAGGLSRGSEKSDRPMGLKMQAVAEAIRAGATPVQEVKALFFTDGGDGVPRAKLGTKAIDDVTLEWLAREQARLLDVVTRARACRVGRDTLYALTLATTYAAEYEAAKAGRGALDFSDLISAAKELLTNEETGAAWVLFKLDGGVDHILVDEAQDTSPEQWEIVRALTDEFFRGAGAREGGVERTLFVVGDEKQSIFSFQGAAPERLLRESQWYRKQITGAGRRFEDVKLLDSWRSTPEVLKFVDQVFFDAGRAQALSPGRGLIGDRADEKIRHNAARPDGMPGTIDVWDAVQEQKSEERRAWDEPMDADATRGARRQVADRIVAEVRGMVERDEGVHDKETGQWRAADWGDVLILVKKRGPMFEEILRALKQGGVPVAGADRLKLSEHAVFQDLLALGRAALFPEDDLTLAGVLRSPLCDVSEQALFDLAHGRGAASLWRVLKDRAQTDDAARAAVELVAGFRAAARQRTPFDLYAGLLNRLDAHGLTMRQRFLTRLGGEAADALDAFLDQAQAAEMRGIMDLERLCHALASLTQTVKREMDEPRGEVRVMTAHSSKGLEAPVVIVPDTIFEEPKGDALLETEEGGFLWCGSSKGDCDASAEAREARKRRNEEESMRLLYVGLTRARDRLIVGGRYASNRKLENLRAWWGPLDEAIQSLGGREIESHHGGRIRRFGEDPQPCPRMEAASAVEVAAPAWLGQAVSAEAGERALSPSRMGGIDGAPAPSPLTRSGAGGLGRFRRGDLIHRLLERLPDVAVEARADLALRLLSRERDISHEQKQEMIGAALGILNDGRFAPVFGPGSRAEVALTGRIGGAIVSGRMDRLVVSADRVLVVDYKTNRPAPLAIEDADPVYIVQMAVYVSVLRQIYPAHRVEAALVWTDGPNLMPIPEEMLARALAR